MTRIYETFINWLTGIVFPDDIFDDINWTTDFDEEL